jgi:hypothetical protein
MATPRPTGETAVTIALRFCDSGTRLVLVVAKGAASRHSERVAPAVQRSTANLIWSYLIKLGKFGALN